MKKLVQILVFWLLLLDNHFCKGYSHQKQNLMKNVIAKQNKKPLYVTRELTDHLEVNDSDGLKSDNIREETTETDTEETATPPVNLAVTRTPTIKPTRDGYSCKCLLKDIMKQTFRGATILGIPQRDIDEDATATDSIKRSVGESTRTTSIPFTKSPNLEFLGGFVLNETHFELKEPEFETSVDIRGVCPHYRLIPELNVKRMADVWQLIYYKAHESLSCFKIFLKRTTPESRDYYKRKYSSFDETINWDESYLELTPTGKSNKGRHHFLQGPKNSILENIVITDESLPNNTKIIILHEQAPGQWMVTKNLLLMRDCDNGDVVVLRRVPSVPHLKDIEEAMIMFGENGLRNIVPCRDAYKKEKVPKWNLKHHIAY